MQIFGHTFSLPIDTGAEAISGALKIYRAWFVVVDCDFFCPKMFLGF